MVARKIKGSWYVDFRFEGRRVRKKSPLNTRKGAIEFEHKERSRMILGRSDPRALPLFREFAVEWFESYARANNKPATLAARRCYLDRHVLPFFGPMRIDLISGYQIERYKAHMRPKGLSASTVNGTLTTLSVALRCAEEWGLLQSAPRVKLLKQTRPPPRWLSQSEVEALLAACDPELEAKVLFCLLTGSRVGEMMALRWENVDLLGRKLYIFKTVWHDTETTPKSGRGRTIPIASELRRVLMLRSPREGLVFPGRKGGFLVYETLLKAIHDAAERAGIPRLGWHVLRHTFATRALASGANLRQVQDLLGHSCVRMTASYTHTTADGLAGVVDALNFGPQTGIVARR